MDDHAEFSTYAMLSMRPGINGFQRIGCLFAGSSPNQAIEIPVPANDDAGRSAFPSPLSCTPVFWLDLIEVDGQVLLAANFDGDFVALRSLRRQYGNRTAEVMINTIFLDELFDTEKYDEDRLVEFGTVICESLRMRASKAFPDRSFVTELFASMDTGKFGVRLYQDKQRPCVR